MAGENTQASEPNWLEMSDEELLNAPLPDFSAPAANEEAKDPDPGATAAKANTSAEEEEEDAEDATAPAAAGKPGDEESEEEAKEEKDPAEGEEAKDPKGEKAPVKEAKKEEKKEGEPAAEVDYAAAGKELLAPFKANGRDIQVRSVEDARALMQMGANYNKKMAALKPNLRLMKMLENNGLLSEDKLSFLIDLSKKDQGAINKLVKDSGLNPLDLDADKAGEYKPKSHTVDEREVDLDNVLTDLEGSAAYSKTLDLVAKWDGPSKQVVAQNPELLQVLHDHVASGIYDLIAAEIERERTFGRLKGMSGIEAYRQVGDAIQARGGFNHLGSSQGKTSPDAKVVVQPKPKSASDDKRDEKRKALSSPKPAAGSPKTDADFNPLSMSDAEFEKQAAKRFR